MNFINKMEKKIGKYAIKNLTYYIIALYILGFIINMTRPDIYINYLSLDAGAILQGQVWRIITFIIAPPSTSAFFVIFALYLYYMIGTNLENSWGAFKFNLYFFMGVILHVVAAIFVYLAFGVTVQLTTYYLNMSLFLAFAALFPDIKLLLFFIIPIKIKWLAIADAVYFGLVIISGFVTYFATYPELYTLYGDSYDLIRNSGLASSIAALLSLLNFAIFFFGTKKHKNVSPAEIYRKAKYKRETTMPKNVTGPRHRCATCGKTEADGEELVFRYCSKCQGNQEYCQDHLFTHEHVHK